MRTNGILPTRGILTEYVRRYTLYTGVRSGMSFQRHPAIGPTAKDGEKTYAPVKQVYIEGPMKKTCCIYVMFSLFQEIQNDV